ncbi:hypothetical protein T265_02188 [Opisthorchis viverrini]|uniref:Ras family protein n=1 Tax=Opisthorchis viverrini TaxID=6198 RepID=A0A074ZW86_OPIVI|nr:hypothetical protein T265_02188 [Opisthorchis viverrini]KER31688.1 hypothetical protein T265_02188 [Opisthorchis viverrini]
MGTMQVPTVSVRMCMLGSGSVGKSALTLQFMYEEFVEDYEPTKSSAYKRKVNIEDICVEVDITDTAEAAPLQSRSTPSELPGRFNFVTDLIFNIFHTGQEDYAGINDPFYRNNDGFIVVFSLTDKESLKAVPLILERIVQCRGDEQSPVVLVGNKVDLVDERAVPAESAIQLAQKWQIPYLETSARNRHNLEEVQPCREDQRGAARRRTASPRTSSNRIMRWSGGLYDFDPRACSSETCSKATDGTGRINGEQLLRTTLIIETPFYAQPKCEVCNPCRVSSKNFFQASCPKYSPR